MQKNEKTLCNLEGKNREKLKINFCLSGNVFASLNIFIVERLYSETHVSSPIKTSFFTNRKSKPKFRKKIRDSLKIKRKKKSRSRSKSKDSKSKKRVSFKVSPDISNIQTFSFEKNSKLS